MQKLIVALALCLAVSGVSAATICPKYVVAPGDSLFSISQKFDILPDALIASLQACGQSTENLQVRQEICLPGAELPGCSNVRPFNNDANCQVYIVQQGDTVSSVAASLNVYNVELQNLNNDVTSAGILKPNTYLRLPQWSQSCGDPNKSGDSCRSYIVQAGDFISGIAAAFRVDINEMLAVNPGLTADSVLQNGQPIKVPPFPANCGVGVPTKPPTDTVLKCRGYRVQQGDDIASIAQKFKTTFNDVLSVNAELQGGAIVQPGAVIKVPPYDDSCTQPILVSDADTPTPDGTNSPAPGPVVTIVPPVASPPVVIAPSPIVKTPPPAPVPAPSPAPLAPAPQPAVKAPTPAPTPTVVAESPESGAVAVKLFTVFAVIAALAF